MGRDRDCDIRFQDINPDDLTLISRVHAILRFDGAQWVVVDKSQNGVYVAGSRANLVAIHDRLSITLGSPRGPQLTFRVAASATSLGTRHRRPTRPGPSPRRPCSGRRAPPPPTRAQTRPPVRPAGSQPRPSQPDIPARTGGGTGGCRRRRSRRGRRSSRGSATVGRAKTNNVVVDDALASRVHAVLVSSPAGLEIRDNNSSNGTFVNGTLITRAMLRDGDVVTIGNTDLLATGNTLVPQPAAAREQRADRPRVGIDR